MTISGIVVACRPKHTTEVCEAVNALSWAQVHHTDRHGRLVVTIEAAGTDESMDRLKQLQGLGNVIMAELAGYYVGEEDR